MKVNWFRWQYLLAFICVIFLLVLPLFANLYYLAGYYVFIGFLTLILFLRIVYEKPLEERFYSGWQKARRKGFWPNFIIGSLGGFVFMVLMVAAGQLFGNGLAPTDIVKQLPAGGWAVVMFILVFFSFLAGIAWWHENEKRYSRIYYREKYRSND